MESSLDLINVCNANHLCEEPSKLNVFHYIPFYKPWETQLFIILGTCSTLYYFTYSATNLVLPLQVLCEKIEVSEAIIQSFLAHYTPNEQ